MQSLLARDNGFYLASVDDAMDIIASGLTGCIFTTNDIHSDFFNLRNRLAGEVFQKFINYNVKAAFVVPAEHDFGERVAELIRDHAKHPFIRFFSTTEDAMRWLK